MFNTFTPHTQGCTGSLIKHPVGWSQMLFTQINSMLLDFLLHLKSSIDVVHFDCLMVFTVKLVSTCAFLLCFVYPQVILCFFPATLVSLRVVSTFCPCATSQIAITADWFLEALGVLMWFVGACWELQEPILSQGLRDTNTTCLLLLKNGFFFFNY